MTSLSRSESLGSAPYRPVCVRKAAEALAKTYKHYYALFKAIAHRAPLRFEKREWLGVQEDAIARLRVYPNAVDEIEEQLRSIVPFDALSSKPFWDEVKPRFIRHFLRRYDADLALTFFYSVERRILSVEGIPVQYQDDGIGASSHVKPRHDVCRRYALGGGEELAELVQTVLKGYSFHPFSELQSRSSLAAERLRHMLGGCPLDLVEVLAPVFYRNKEAYVIGRIRSGKSLLPFALALLHGHPGITLDAVLTGEDDMENFLFTSTRSSFSIAPGVYHEIADFLETIAPQRGRPGLYAAIGAVHPAKIELNQELQRHLKNTCEILDIAPGYQGDTMIGFAPPSFHYVLKVVRDRLRKTYMTRERVISQYRRVHEIDRAGRLLDAWLFVDLEFAKKHFSEALLRELRDASPESVAIEGDSLILKHVYIQRKVEPTFLRLQRTIERKERERIVAEFGQFVKDITSMGIFHADYFHLTANTGITRGGRGVLFDFDDVDSLDAYAFRSIPPPDTDDDMWNTEDDGVSFDRGPKDVFPEEWKVYLAIPEDLIDYFTALHGDLFNPTFWQDAQRRFLSGEVSEILPYPPERRLAPQ